MERPGTRCWDGARTPGLTDGQFVRNGAGGWGLYALTPNTRKAYERSTRATIRGSPIADKPVSSLVVEAELVNRRSQFGRS